MHSRRQVKQVVAALKQGRKAAEGNSQVLHVLHEVQHVIDGMGPGGDLYVASCCYHKRSVDTTTFHSKRFLSTPHPWLLRLLLGRKTCVVAWSTSRSLSIKEEYHTFKCVSCRASCSYTYTT